MNSREPLFTPLELPCGVILKNRIVKAAMSDSLGDGYGNPTRAQVRLYERWADGGIAAAIIGEVQGNPHAAEKPGNLVLGPQSNTIDLRALAQAGNRSGAHLWLQLGHAGAMTHAPTGIPKGPSALEIAGLSCPAFSLEEIQALPDEFARTARMAQEFGFGGVQVHAAHGFLLSQFLSPLFNHRSDAYGGPIKARMRLLLEVITAVRAAVGPSYPIAVKLNATDQLEGGLTAQDALMVVQALQHTSIDLIDISGGTYFPGAKSASDAAGVGPYFVDFANAARAFTTLPLMLTGGFKTRAQAVAVLASGDADIIGLARALALYPELPNAWQNGQQATPKFPRFNAPPEGGVTAWYSMNLTRLGEDRPSLTPEDMATAVTEYEVRDTKRTQTWTETFP